jgi:hypothetical protein
MLAMESFAGFFRRGIMLCFEQVRAHGDDAGFRCVGRSSGWDAVLMGPSSTQHPAADRNPCAGHICGRPTPAEHSDRRPPHRHRPRPDHPAHDTGATRPPTCCSGTLTRSPLHDGGCPDDSIHRCRRRRIGEHPGERLGAERGVLHMSRLEREACLRLDEIQPRCGERGERAP